MDSRLYGVVLIRGDETYSVLFEGRPDKVLVICYLADWAENGELSLSWADIIDTIAKVKHSDFVVERIQ